MSTRFEPLGICYRAGTQGGGVSQSLGRLMFDRTGEAFTSGN